MERFWQIELDRDSDYAIGRVMKDEACSYVDFEDIELGTPIDVMFFDAIIEPLDNGYVLRRYQGHFELDEDIQDYVLNINEVYREYWYEGVIRYYAYDFESDSWVRISKKKYTETEASYEPYYIINYENDYDPTSSGIIDEILNEHTTCDTFIETLGKNYKAFRTLKKYGFNDVLNDFVYIGGIFNDSDKISEVLALDYNKVVADMSAEEITAWDILAMRELAEIGLKFTQRNIDIMRVMRSKPHMFDQISREDMRRTFKYLRNQQNRGNRNAVIDYADYLSECVALEYNLAQSDIRYPTDLLAAHARTSGLITLKNNADTEERIKELYAACREYIEWTDGKYSVVMPASCLDIVEEGKRQNHCVGSYAERMAKGEDMIVFIRRNAERDKAFYTMEIHPDLKNLDIVQCRGYGNKDESAELRASVDEFISQYKSWFDSRPCDTNVNMRRKYYKAVHKTEDGRYISNWDQKTEYRIGEVITARTEPNPDVTAAPGIHVASLEFARKYGENWSDAAILEIEVDLRDVVVPNAKDQVRTRRGKVLREVTDYAKKSREEVA